MARILVVDDSIVMRKNLSTILRGAGHEIAGEASNGRHAVAQYQELKPDLVTMDISMPIMSGVEAVQQIIDFDPEALIIMISAVNQKKMVFNAINSGAKHYIIKPIETDKVLGVVGEVLSTDYEAVDEDVITEDVNEQGFEINNEEGRFVIRFNKSLGLSDHGLLKMAVNGILFIKPLKVVFDFSVLESISDEILGPILALAETIQSNEGEVTYKSDSEAVREKLPG